MNKLTDEQWQEVFTIFCHNCFVFWKSEGCSVPVAFDKAREETLSLRRYPFKPNGEEVDLQSLHKWGERYNQDTVGVLYQYEENNALGDLRLCEHCGFPIFEGYYVAGEYFCCEQCAIDGSYNGDKQQFEQDLKEADNPKSSMWDEVYWSQWDYPIND